MTATKHTLVGNSLFVERDADGRAKGIIGRCTFRDSENRNWRDFEPEAGDE